jgi:dihydroxyacid dehydratase/phosphogluconate dehydratase
VRWTRFPRSFGRRSYDLIEIDIKARRLSLELEEAEIRRRLDEWNPPLPRVTKGVLVNRLTIS